MNRNDTEESPTMTKVLTKAMEKLHIYAFDIINYSICMMERGSTRAGYIIFN